MSALANLMRQIKSWIRKPNSSLPTADLAQQIDEELMFHFHALVEENMNRGMSQGDACSNAEHRFGSSRQYAKEIWRIEMGPYLTLQRILIGGLFALCLLCAGLWLQVEKLHRETGEQLTQSNTLIEQLNTQIVQLKHNFEQAKLEADKADNSHLPLKLCDFSGAVLDDAGHPLPEVQLLVILKSWPGGRYQQESFAAISNDQGQFRLPELVAIDKQYAVQVAALKSGYAFQSNYQLKNAMYRNSPNRLTFNCTKRCR
jgi:hypothetical protein